jgi:hypothetical protein
VATSVAACTATGAVFFAGVFLATVLIGALFFAIFAGGTFAATFLTAAFV